MDGEEFDFEHHVQVNLPKITDDTITAEIGSCRVGDQKHRIIVCKHWLVGLCHNGNMCSFLHRLDFSRMPPCKHGEHCKIKNCPLKHVAVEELEECIFYKQGFCYNGPKCGRRHVKRTPDQCPQEYPFDQVASVQAQSGKRLKAGQPNDNFKVTLCTHWLLSGECPFGGECHYAHGEAELREGYQANSEFLFDDDILDRTRGIIGVPLEFSELKLNQNPRCAYFILQSPDLRSLVIAKRRGVWAVPTRIAQEMNAVFRSMDFVILFFSVRSLRGIYGVAKMAGSIPTVGHGVPLTPEFPIVWWRTMRVPLSTVAQLKLGSTGMFVGRSSIDGRFDKTVGLHMLLTAFRKPEWNWMEDVQAAERNIRLVDPVFMGMPNAAPPGEYYPQGGQSAYYLPEDVLFAQDWIDRAGMEINEKGIIIKLAGNDGTAGNGPGKMAPMRQAAPPSEFYTGTAPGFIICAPTAVIEEMFHRMLFGLPILFKDLQISASAPLFIFDTQTSIMLGIFYANSPVTMNLDATAFTWGGYHKESTLPVQFRFRHAMECSPMQIPIQDPELQKALGEAIKNMGQLDLPTTKSVANLFAKRCYQAFPHLLANRGGPNRGPQRGPPGPSGPQGGGFGSSVAGGYYKPPFRHVEVVPVDIGGNLFDIRRRLLGNNAMNIIQLVDSIGSKQTIRVRMRGVGSGFTEGPSQQELPEPMHFNVSAENEQLLAQTVGKLHELIAKVRRELMS